MRVAAAYSLVRDVDDATDAAGVLDERLCRRVGSFHAGGTT
jgi:hypothetical protein